MACSCGKVKRLKVRLVVQGQHMSKEKGDFVNAFSPVPHASGVRTIMSIATEQDWDGLKVRRLYISARHLEWKKTPMWYTR